MMSMKKEREEVNKVAVNPKIAVMKMKMDIKLKKLDKMAKLKMTNHLFYIMMMPLKASNHILAHYLMFSFILMFS